MARPPCTIGRIAEAGGVKVQTIRYYEHIGLLPAPERSLGNQRLYSKDHVERVRFIRNGRELGFSIDQIRALLALGDDVERSCQDVDTIATAHLEDVERRIDRLKGLREELKRMVASCAGGQVSQCRIIEVLSQPLTHDPIRHDVAEDPDDATSAPHADER